MIATIVLRAVSHLVSWRGPVNLSSNQDNIFYECVFV
jgi:hypothetical protein